MRRVGNLPPGQEIRRHDLLWFLLSWAHLRRPGEEWETIQEVAMQSQADVARRKEVQEMSGMVGPTRQEVMLQEIDRAAAQATVEATLATLRETVRMLLAERIGTVPDALLPRIEGCSDEEKLKQVLRELVRDVPVDRLSL